LSIAVARNRLELARATDSDWDPAARRIALVPTMGALHAGHTALIERAAKESDEVVVSIFVNPLQFGPGEDYERYPRTFDADLVAAEQAGATVVFAPSVDEMYPAGRAQITIDPGPLGSELEGASRPGHYRGVLTVVAKLFGAVRPDLAIFGEKDYQQFVLIEAMVHEFGWPVELVAAPTVREADGVALSSRNSYLTPEQRLQAVSLSRALRAGAAAAGAGAAAAEAAARDVLAAAAEVEVDYLVVRDPQLGPAPPSGPCRILVAAKVGATRLIDNMSVQIGDIGTGPG
jgi:pantoate--beta-alanine ligase